MIKKFIRESKRQVWVMNGKAIPLQHYVAKGAEIAMDSECEENKLLGKSFKVNVNEKESSIYGKVKDKQIYFWDSMILK